jgi:phage terminase Nu1 subunit (DNA packaging protein)
MQTTSKIIVNQAAICAALNISSTHVNRLEKEGVIIKLDNNRYDLIRSVKRYIKRLKGDEGSENGSDYYAERSRLTKAQADERELKIKKERAELIPIQTAERVWCDAAILLRNNLLSLPNKLSHVLSPIEDINIISEEIKKELIKTLEAVNVEPEDYTDAT